MDVQPTNGRRVPPPQRALPREALEALWRRLEERQRLGVERHTERVMLEWSDDDIGEMLSEVERLKGELRAARQLRHQDAEDQLLVAPATLAVLLLLARDVAEFQRARGEWLRQRETHTRTVLAMERVLEDVDLVERALRGTPWPSLQALAVEELRALARREGVA